MIPTRVRALDAAVGVLLTFGSLVLILHYGWNAGALWRDEVNSVNVARLPNLYDVYAHSHLDSFPAAWVAVLHAWIAAGLGGTDGSLRWLGMLIAASTVLSWWWVGRQLGLRAPLLTLVLLGMCPTMVVYGSQVRGYGLGVLALGCCFGAFFRFVSAPSRWRYAIAQAASLAAVQTYFGNCFLVAAICAAAAAVCARRRRFATAWAVVGLGAVAAMSMALNWFSVRYASRLASIEQGDFGLAWYAQMLWGGLAPGVPLLSVAWVVAAAAALCGCVLTSLGAPPREAETDRERALYVSVAAVASLVCYGAYLEFISVHTQVWYYLPLMAVLAFFCDVGTDLLAVRSPRGAMARPIVAALVALAVAVGSFAVVRVRMTNVDVIAEKLTREAAPGDLIVVFPWYCGITFQHYYRGAVPWMTIPDFEEHAYHLHALVAEKMALREAAVAVELTRVEDTLRRGGRVWIAGALVAPEPGQPPRPLPPADAAVQRAGTYLDNWEQQLGALLRGHADEVWNVELPDVGPVNTWETLPLLLAEGWH